MASRELWKDLFHLFRGATGAEGHPALRLALRIFLVMLACYLLKPAREALILSGGGAAHRSYAVAAQAALQILTIPLLGHFLVKRRGESLFRSVTLTFVATLVGFRLAELAGLPVGFLFFAWFGLFNITLVAQFWALTTDLETLEFSPRVLSFITVGGSIGALVGAQAARFLIPWVGGPINLLLVAAFALLASLWIGRGVFGPGHALQHTPLSSYTSLGRSLAKVLGSPYLRLVAVFVVLLNTINTTGEYILARVVTQRFSNLTLPGESAERIGAFYADFFFKVNLASLLILSFLAPLILKRIGVRGAIMILPLITVAGYGLAAALPCFVVVVYVKALENSMDYSIQSTTLQALSLPVGPELKHQGKLTIDIFFWRLGDLAQVGLVLLGTVVLGFDVRGFAVLNLLLSLGWLGLAIWIGKHYAAMVDAQAPAIPLER